MKKLALVLGSLLVVGSVASAKEVMPAPTPAPEKVVEYVEKPVIVYRDREVAPAWRPNGSVDVQYRWYGEVEKKNPKDDKDENWATGKVNAGRLQTLTKVNFTEKQTLEVRTRNHHTLNDTDANNKKSNGAADEYRLRHFYNFGKLGSSKVNATSRVEFKQKTNDGEKSLGASVLFDFADYIYSNNFFKVDKLGLRPGYKYVWKGHGNGEEGTPTVHNEYHLAFESDFTLPFNFALNLEYDLSYNRYREKFETTDGLKKAEWYGELTAVLSNYTPLYKAGAFELGFNAEGGYDTYNMHQYKRIGGEDGTSVDRRDYELYLEPTLQVSYKPTDFVKLYAAAGADYRNRITGESEVKRWRWQPTAWAGMKVTF
ncbi:Uncharacterised protein [Fusobacterium polymorphum]|uniref:Porin FomA n=1 Tax=Fusobacterium polymorphum ATCC 10953 TaxID=393480 RepID=A5TV43_FUSNP|nr:hypothetical protein [Fusobacterium polymorphum]EDK88768.1 porin FomA [Fusobacterium polymorphum ATCC 10953]UTI53513.1 hypothetical protein NLJ26_02540 [Fusobacterium polymorphum]WRL68042.1 hypothetical protein VKN78_09580 [Fusobacterium polymorphum]CKG73301.1 Uncharacterised protein [Fusobacterium polymorphum]